MEYTDNSVAIFKSRAGHARDNFYYLNVRSNFLDDTEKKILKTIGAKSDWNINTDCLWLDLKRQQMDEDYKELRTIERKAAKTQTDLNNTQLKQAQANPLRLDPTGLPMETDKDMEVVWNYLKTNPRMRRRLYGE